MNEDRWTIYEELVAGIPGDLVVEDCLVGLHWVLVRSRGVGMAMTPGEGGRRHALGALRGRRVRELAEACRSWNFLEAAIGMAALNSWHNAPGTLSESWNPAAVERGEGSSLDDVGRRAAGRKLAVIGHFPHVENLAAHCELSVLERRPSPGDFPDPACEFVLPQQDVVLATGTTLMNKTLPRLLELSRQAEFVLTGPTTPLCPSLLEHGVDELAGCVVTNVESTWRHVAEGGDKSVFQNGCCMLRLRREDLP